MTRFQPLRGNPETKLSTLMNDFSGGINLVDEDDFVGANQLRHASNVSITMEGNVTNRKGWNENRALNDLLDSFRLRPTLNKGYKYFLYEVKYDSHYSASAPTAQNTLFRLSTKGVNSGDKLRVKASKLANKDWTGTVDDFGITVKIGESTNYFYVPVGNNINTTFELDFDDGDNKPDLMTVEIAHNGHFAEARDLLIYVDKYETEVVNNAHNFEGFFLLKDRFNQFNNLLNSKDFDDFVDKYSVDTVQSLGTNPDLAGVTVYSTKPPLVLLTLYRNYKNDLFAHFGFVYNGNIEEQVLPLVTGVDIASTNNYVEGNVRIVTNVYNAIHREEFFFSVRGKHVLIGLEDISGDNVTDQFSKYKMNQYGKDATSNKAYKPTPYEVRRVGFNVLGTNPLTWIEDYTSGVDSIRGIFLTLGSNVPLNYIPSMETFRVNILINGSTTPSIKFYHFVGETKEELNMNVGDIKGSGSLRYFEVSVADMPSSEVEIELTLSSVKYRDYYDVQDVVGEPRPVETLDVGNYNVVNVHDRTVYYGGNTIWWSDFNHPSYVPNYNYARLPFSESQDEIVAITFFRSSYMIFTRERIYKLSGGFDPSSMMIDIVSEEIGCIAPKTIKMVENKLFFLSARGLYSLRSETFRADMEHLQPVDDKVHNLFRAHSFNTAIAFVKDEQYMLVLNQRYNTSTATGSDSFKVGRRDFKVPDVVRYYHDSDAYVFDDLANGESFDFVLNISNNLLSFKGDKGYVYEECVKDFGEPYKVSFETASMSFSYPAHEKKIKKLWVKMNKESFEQTVRIHVYMDGYHAYTIDEFPEGYVEVADLPNSVSDQRLVRLPSLKGRNITIRLEVEEEKSISFNSIALEWKLGKMRG